VTVELHISHNHQPMHKVVTYQFLHIQSVKCLIPFNALMLSDGIRPVNEITPQQFP